MVSPERQVCLTPALAGGLVKLGLCRVLAPFPVTAGVAFNPPLL